jgi:hypothetical protein
MRTASYQSLLKSFKSLGIFKSLFKIFPIILSISGCLLLLSATLYGAKQANYAESNNSDNLVLPYLFKGFKRHDIVLASQHSNILNFPIYIMQAVLPYNYTTLSLVNIGLVCVTVFVWVYLLVRIFGKKYIAMICIILSAFLLTSYMFQSQILGNTIRNIEYPIGLGFLLIINQILKKHSFNRKYLILGIVDFILFSVSIAGDSLIAYCFVLPALIAIFVWWLQSRHFSLQMQKATGIIVGAVVVSFIVKYCMHAFGIVTFYNVAAVDPQTLPANSLSFSLTTALQQVLSLHGAPIFGIGDISLSQSIIFLNFLILTVALVGFITIFRGIGIPYKSKAVPVLNERSNFLMLSMALSFFITFGIYILSDQVVHQLANGSYVSSEQYRYLTLLPFLSIAGFIYIVDRYYATHKALLNIIPVVILGTLIISLPYIHSTLRIGETGAANFRNTINQVISVADKNDVKIMLTGYWYGASTRFWSHNTIQYATVAACDNPQPTDNNKRSFYVANSTVHTSALLVDRSGPDESYWMCTRTQLTNIYGRPTRIFYINGVDSSGKPVKNSLQLWIYHYDVRSKIVHNLFE